MSKLTIALGSLMGAGNKNYCPDCGSTLNSNGTCPDCGYGEEDDMEEEDDRAETESLLEIKNQLSLIMQKIDRMIAEND